MLAIGDAARLPLSDASVDLVVGSPPYALVPRTYGLVDSVRGGSTLGEWVDWMLGVTREALRVTRGLVVWVVAGCVRSHVYQPGPELLLAKAFEAGLNPWRPVYWRRNGIPGSGGRHWYRPDVEVCLAFARASGKPDWYSDPLANGSPPKYSRAGGRRKWRRGGGRGAAEKWRAPAVANPGNVIDTKGGHLGSRLAHENEAPYPVAVPAFFVHSCCPPDGLVLDPFCGSGTTLQAARECGRRFLGLDVRRSQCELSRRRLGEIDTGAVAC